MKNTHDFPKIEGKYVNFREAEIDDSEFILELRTDPEKEKFIHKTDPDINKQIQYMKNYKTLDNDWYFIIEDKECNPIGTNSVYPYPIFTENWKDEEASILYNQEVGVMGTGRWLMINDINPIMGMETDIIIKDFFFNVLNLSFTPMLIHKDNLSVLKYQQLWGAKIVGWRDDISQHMLELTKENYLKNRLRFERMVYGTKKGEYKVSNLHEIFMPQK